MTPFPAKSALKGLALLFLLLAGAGKPVLAQADPTAEQQYWLELVNRFRLDPAGELERLTNYSVPGASFANPPSDNPDVTAALQFYGTSAAVLATQWAGLTAAPAIAWNTSLAGSASAYSDVMAAFDQQAHNLDGLALEDRILNGGYTVDYLELGETLFGTAASALHGHAAFAIDWGDDDGNAGNGFGTGVQSPATHRDLIIDPLIKEGGIGFQTTSLAGNVNVTGPLVTTQHFASQFRVNGGSSYVADAFITGVVFSDVVAADSFYTPGEGMGGITVNVYDDAANTLLKTGMTNTAGGYNILLDGLTDGSLFRVEAPTTGLGPQFFTLNERTVLYPNSNPGGPDIPVTYYDNAYAAFALVPEPGSALLLASGLALFFGARKRPQRRAGERESGRALEP